MFQKSTLFFLLFLILSGCSLFSPMKENKLSIGSFPDELAQSLDGRWTVWQSSTCGEPCISELDWTGGLPGHFFIKSPKEDDLLLLLFPPPITEGCVMNPLGVFIPSYKDYGELNLKDGAAVKILMTLRQNHLNIEDFNISRLIAEMGELDDPWLVEEQTLLKQLGRREMRSWYIRTKTLFDIDIKLPDGLWYGVSLLQAPIESGSHLSTVLELPEGYSFLYSFDRSQLIEIQVDDHGEAVWITETLSQGAPSQ